MGARDRCAGIIDRFLVDAALAKECTSDDLSVALYRLAEQVALDCYRLGGEDKALELGTLELGTKVSQVMPVTGVWEKSPEELTPVVVDGTGRRIR